MGRPNRDRTKSTVYLGAEDRQRIETIRRSYRLRTDAAAIRRALEVATEPLSPDLQAMVELVQFVDRLQFMSPRERAELRTHVAKLYEMVALARSRSLSATQNAAAEGTSPRASANGIQERQPLPEYFPKNCDVFGVPPD